MSHVFLTALLPAFSLSGRGSDVCGALLGRARHVWPQVWPRQHHRHGQNAEGGARIVTERCCLSVICPFAFTGYVEAFLCFCKVTDFAAVTLGTSEVLFHTAQSLKGQISIVQKKYSQGQMKVTSFAWNNPKCNKFYPHLSLLSTRWTTTWACWCRS